MPPFVQSLAFWKALSFVVAAIYLYFNPGSIVTDVLLLQVALAVLNLIGVNPEIRARGFQGWFKK